MIFHNNKPDFQLMFCFLKKNIQTLLFRRVLFFCLVTVFLFSFIQIFHFQTQVNSQATSLTVDEQAVDLFSGIPNPNIIDAKALTLMLRRASVGGNISSGLDTLHTQNTKYDQSNWAFQDRGNPGWAEKITDFENQVALQLSSREIFSMKFCYIDTAASWTEYRDHMEALQTANPTKTFIWWTMPIMTTGDASRDAFNASVRSYATTHDIILFDIAAIESHDPDGNPVTNGGYEAMYGSYSSDGGHLSATGQERMAQAWWYMMARISGWNGNPSPTPDPADWPQLQRDPQRTGYSPVQINPNYSINWKWNTTQTNPIRSSMKIQPVALGGMVYFGGYDGKMYAIDATSTTDGSEVTATWSYQTNGPIFNSAAADQGKVFFGSDDGSFYALDAATGDFAWSLQTGSGIWTAPLVVNNTVYFGSRDGKFYALNESDGAYSWTLDTGSPILQSATYSNNQNTIYFGSENMYAYALNASSGSQIWSKKLAGQSMRDSWPVVDETHDIVFFRTMPEYTFSNQRADITGSLSADLATEMSNFRTYYTNNPSRISFYALDTATGNDKFADPVPVAYAGGSGLTPAPPTISANGDIFVPTRAGGNNYQLPSCSNMGDDRCSGSLVKLNATTGDVSYVVPNPNNATIGQAIRVISDEESMLSLSGSRLIVSMSQAVGQILTSDNTFSHIIHERQPTLDNANFGTSTSIFQAPTIVKFSTETVAGHVAPPYGPAIVASGLIIWRADGGAIAGIAGQ